VEPDVRYARSGDLAIAYRVVGEGPFDVVFHPGFISHVELISETPTFQGRMLERLASIARVLVLDQRGMGMSDRVAGAPSLEARMDDVRAVMDAAGSSRAAIFSQSMGVPMSVLFAATYPERTTAVVLLRSFARELWAPDYPWGWTPDAHRQRVEAFAAVHLRPSEAGDALRAVGIDFTDDDLDYFRRAAASPGTIETLAMINRDIDVRPVLPAVRVPTLLIHAVDEPTWPVGGARYMADTIPGAKLVEVPGSTLLTGDGFDQALDTAQRFLLEVWDAGGWEEPEPDRILATVLFTDIVGSSDRAAALGDRAWRELLAAHDSTVRRQLTRFRGSEVNTTGDGFVASFDGPARAIRCACAIVDSLGELGLEVRAGLHTGECELVNGNIAGIAVHTGARVAGAAEPNEILVSGTVRDLVAGSGFDFEDRGLHELKGIPGEWRLFAVDRDSAQVV
jgi:class 3 adenylate cyclase/pimeloyl-ACP methyl ester carboxylesterase